MDLRLILDSSSSRLESDDFRLISALDEHLTYDVPGAQYSKAVKQGYYNKYGDFIIWDGKKKLLNSDLSFPVGLTDRVRNFLLDKNIEFEEVNNKIKIPSISRSILDKLNVLNKTPYPYQLRTVNDATERDYGIIRIATGGGKTIISALLTAKLNKSTIIYVIGKDLLYQVHKLYSSLFDEPIGIIGDGNCVIHDINIASVWTIGQALGLKKKDIIDETDDEKSLSANKYKTIKEMMCRTKVHILDECHAAACKTIQEISKAINPEYLYGMSASPWREDGADLLIESILGKIIVNISASYLIKEGYLVKPYFKFIKTPLCSYSSRNYHTIYKECIIDNQERTIVIARAVEKMVHSGRRVLTLFNNLNHGQKLFNEISRRVPSKLLSGSDDYNTRERVKDDLENGALKSVIASRIFDIGIDLPILSGLILAGSGKSTIRAIQRPGRVMRKCAGKISAAILDFWDEFPYLESHSQKRYDAYSSEEEFSISLPNL